MMESGAKVGKWSISGQGEPMASRERAAAVLRDKARRMHREASRLDALADIAEQLDGDAEEALWDLATRGGR